jgi:hypothetical protein
MQLSSQWQWWSIRPTHRLHARQCLARNGRAIWTEATSVEQHSGAWNSTVVHRTTQWCMEQQYIRSMLDRTWEPAHRAPSFAQATGAPNQAISLDTPCGVPELLNQPHTSRPLSRVNGMTPGSERNSVRYKKSVTKLSMMNKTVSTVR